MEVAGLLVVTLMVPVNKYLPMYKTISAISIVFIVSVTLYLLMYKSKDPDTSKNKRTDTFQELKETNPDFKAGNEALNSGDTKAAIEAFTAAKNSSLTKAEEAVAQYNIANAKLNDGQRYPAVDEYLKLINDETLPPRTRSLAMNEVYLLYRGYSDINILQQAYGKQDISSLPIETAEYVYAVKSYNLYPFAMTIARMMTYEMGNVKTKEEVQAIYDKYSPAFDKSLVQINAASGEKRYIGSSMLGKARVLTIMQKYNLVSRAEVEKMYEDTIQKTRELKMGNTEQFSILRYTDYEMTQGYIAKADALIAILSKMTLSTMVKENLMSRKAQSEYPALLKLKIESKSTTTQAFFKSINW